MTQLRNFDVEVDPVVKRKPAVARVTSAVEAISSVTVSKQPSAARAFLVKDSPNWTWTDLRDYVVTQIESRTGVFPRDPRKEASIFKSFLSRYDGSAVAIAKYAFEVSDGYWAGAPMSVNRFCKASDPFFGDIIVDRLTHN